MEKPKTTINRLKYLGIWRYLCISLPLKDYTIKNQLCKTNVISRLVLVRINAFLAQIYVIFQLHIMVLEIQ